MWWIVSGKHGRKKHNQLFKWIDEWSKYFDDRTILHIGECPPSNH